MPDIKENNVWTTLSGIDVSKKVKKMGKFSYLSWAWAWGELMKHYPEAYFEFLENEIHSDKTMTVHCKMWVPNKGFESAFHAMWLPVMDNRNNAIVGPNARQISDNKMRCLVKCIAMFGLGHYIFAGEDLPEMEAISGSLNERYSDLIGIIKTGIEKGELYAAAEAWFELDEEEAMELWKAPTKGGPFTTHERTVMHSKEFREAYYGPSQES
ncbi:MAG: DUF1071 domain-containing protein [Nitrosomonadaceae bacterium]